jgi:saccharopine dehydrogenase-like NADP-dependent oxidoreductase
MRVVLMGAGHIGQTIASWLSQTADYEVKVVDCSVVALKSLAHLPLETALIDTSDANELLACMQGFDAVHQRTAVPPGAGGGDPGQGGGLPLL